MGEILRFATPFILYLLCVYTLWRWKQEMDVSERRRQDCDRWKLVADTWEQKARELREDLRLVEKYHVQPDYEKIKWSQEQFEKGKAAAKKILAAIKQEAAGTHIILNDNRLIAETECDGQHFVICFRPDQAANAMMQVHRWNASDDPHLCSEHAHELEKQILLGAKLNV